MQASRFYFFLVVLIVFLLGYLSYRIFQPFLTPITWAIVFCIVFYPVYAFLVRRIKVREVASFLTLVIILVVIIGPFSYISVALIAELKDVLAETETGKTEVLERVLSDARITGMIEWIQPYIGFQGKPADEVIQQSLARLGGSLAQKMSTGFTNVLSFTANFVLMLFTIFFLLRDGPGFLKKVRDYLPFSEEQKDRLTRQTRDMIISTIYGGVIVAMTQGVLGGIAFAILHIGSPVLLGSVMAVASFIPMVGTAIVWVPASLFLVYEGLYLKGIALTLIGIFVISVVDNLLRPLIIGGRTKMPTVIIFFTVLGGIKLFGLLGLVLGPLIFALFLSVFEIFRSVEGGADA